MGMLWACSVTRLQCRVQNRFNTMNVRMFKDKQTESSPFGTERQRTSTKIFYWSTWRTLGFWESLYLFHRYENLFGFFSFIKETILFGNNIKAWFHHTKCRYLAGLYKSKSVISCSIIFLISMEKAEKSLKLVSYTTVSG